MNVKVFKDYEALSIKAADELILTIRQKSNAVICLASGHSPLRACEIFVQKVKEQKLDVSAVHFIGLDEWVDVNEDDPGNGRNFFKKYLIEPLSLKKDMYHLFDISKDLVVECSKMDAVIRQLGGIDVMMVGIGVNGHIGFNEPGVSFDLKSHVIELAQITREVGQKYFSGKKELKKGITLGLSNLMEARKVLLVANGVKKATIVAQALTGPLSSQIPASILQKHPNSLILLDKEAAAELPQNFEMMNR